MLQLWPLAAGAAYRLNQLRYWGIHPSFAFVEESETNGVVARLYWHRLMAAVRRKKGPQEPRTVDRTEDVSLPVPDFQSLMLPTLKALAGGAEPSTTAEVRQRIAAAEGLTTRSRLMLPAVAPVVVVLLLFERPVHAYLDPGSGSMLLQVLLGGFAAVGVVGRLYWHRLTAAVRSLTAAVRRKKGPQEPR